MQPASQLALSYTHMIKKKAELTPSCGVFDFSGHLFAILMEVQLLGSESEYWGS